VIVEKIINANEAQRKAVCTGKGMFLSNNDMKSNVMQEDFDMAVRCKSYEEGGC
jgi:ATP-dependent 26S proteasome regulatory subunit